MEVEMAEYEVYNLVFPDYVNEMEIAEYKFKRIKCYPKRLQQLQHRPPVYPFQEFSIEENPGKNSITSVVIIPKEDKDSVLPWKYKGKALKDVLLLLSLFSQREVFISELGKGICIANPNVFEWGHVLSANIPKTNKFVDNENIEFKNIEQCINEVYSHIRSRDWLEKYGNGFFLLLTKSAFSTRLLEPSFILCWTIWEHLYSILKRNKKIVNKIGNGGAKKIASLMFHYKLGEKNTCEKAANEFYATRKSLVHFGKFMETEINGNPKLNPKLYYYEGCGNNYAKRPNDKSINDAMLFIYLTEILVSKILNLDNKDIFCVVNNLKRRVNERIKFK